MAAGYFSNDTIAAIATSLAGDAGVGIIRISGKDALLCAKDICKAYRDPPKIDDRTQDNSRTTGDDKAVGTRVTADELENFWKNIQPRFLYRIAVAHPQTGNTLDDGLVVCFPKEASFTGEEVVELQLHGGRFLLQTILRLIIELGRARLALPGEFLFRAVQNGKQSLIQATAINQLISAKSMFAVQASRRNIGMQRYQEFTVLAESIRKLLALIELSIDFTDQDVEVISPSKLKCDLDQTLLTLEELFLKMQAALKIAQGIQVTICGLPNAGKSTLFNAILAEERAIVSPEAGTTRDIITEEVLIGSYRVRLADTAGLREGSGFVEKEGIHRAIEHIQKSDLILQVVDSHASTQTKQGFTDHYLLDSKKVVVVLNKLDLCTQKATLERVEHQLQHKGYKVIKASAVKGTGIADVLKQLKETLDQTYGIGLECFYPTEFQIQMITRCRQSLKEAAQLIKATGTNQPELLSVQLSDAVNALSDLVGTTTPDDVLTKIFSEFCIGK